MKKYIKKATALGLTAALTIGSVVSVSATATTTQVPVGGTSAITTTSGVAVPVYKVVVPTAMTFILDPMGMVKEDATAVANKVVVQKAGNLEIGDSAEDTQIITDTGYAIVNLSDVAVRVNAVFTVATGTGVTIMNTDDVNQDNMTNTAKECSFEIVPAAEFTSVSDTGEIVGADYDGAPVIKAAVTNTGGNATLTFALDAPADPATRAITELTTAAVFAFQGALNPIASWVAGTSSTVGDIRVTATYSFVGLSGAMYTAAIDNEVDDTANVVALYSTATAYTKPVYPMFKDKDITDVTSVEKDDLTLTGSVASDYALTISESVFLTLGVGSRAGTISNVKILDASGINTIYTAVATDWARNITTGSWAPTVTTTATAAFRSAKLESGTTYTVRFTYSTGYMLDVTLTIS